MANVLIAAIMGYLIGSIPIGYLVGRSRGRDPREMGSGKMGATNVLRSMGKGASAVVLVGDMAKGALAVALARLFFDGSLAVAVAAGLLAIIGHIFPLFAGFRGGRGVATSLGAMFVINPLVGIIALAVGALVIVTSKVASLGSLMGTLAGTAATAALFAAQKEQLIPVLYCVVAATILFVTHRDNIQRLMTGTERKIQI